MIRRLEAHAEGILARTLDDFGQAFGRALIPYPCYIRAQWESAGHHMKLVRRHLTLGSIRYCPVESLSHRAAEAAGVGEMSGRHRSGEKLGLMRAGVRGPCRRRNLDSVSPTSVTARTGRYDVNAGTSQGIGILN
jgi:hypothetical protein